MLNSDGALGTLIEASLVQSPEMELVFVENKNKDYTETNMNAHRKKEKITMYSRAMSFSKTEMPSQLSPLLSFAMVNLLPLIDSFLYDIQMRDLALT